MLLCKGIEAPSNLSCPIAVPTQGSGSDFTAGMMAEVTPIDSKDTMVVHVYHLMNHGVFHMFFAKEAVLAQQYPVIL